MKVGRSWWLCAAVAGVLGAGVYPAHVQATTSTASSQILAQSVVQPVRIKARGLTLTGGQWSTLLKTRGLTDGYIVDNKFDPGQTTGWHSHSGPSLIFVVSGAVTNYDSTDRHCAGKTYVAGTSFIDEGGDDVHMLRNNGKLPAETIAVQFIPSGQPRRIDKPEPANCHV